jgi:hypothetical protein
MRYSLLVNRLIGLSETAFKRANEPNNYTFTETYPIKDPNMDKFGYLTTFGCRSKWSLCDPGPATTLIRFRLLLESLNAL